jgi:hypothetical protein
VTKYQKTTTLLSNSAIIARALGKENPRIQTGISLAAGRGTTPATYAREPAHISSAYLAIQKRRTTVTMAKRISTLKHTLRTCKFHSSGEYGWNGLATDEKWARNWLIRQEKTGAVTAEEAREIAIACGWKDKQEGIQLSLL